MLHPVHLDQIAGFLRLRFRPSPGSRSEKDDKIDWLEGLRGFVTLLVYLEHSVGFAHENVWLIQRAYGWNGNYYGICFPCVRLFV